MRRLWSAHSGFVVAALSLLFASYARAGLISAPFDNFRIECPQNGGAQRISIRMVESQGMKRQDTVFSLSCNNVHELYPWNGIPDELAELEREECRYSVAFDPIMDTASELSCGPREYVASIVRLYGTKIQVGCCKLRTRDEVNCITQRFGKPFGLNVRTEIENRAMLINSISMDGNFFKVRFCDLTPRAAGLIEEDAAAAKRRKTTTTVSTTRETTQEPTKPIAINVTPNSIDSEESTPPTGPTSTKRVIRVKQPLAVNRTIGGAAASPPGIKPTSAEISAQRTAANQKAHSSEEDGDSESNEITNGVQRSLHGASIVSGNSDHKAKDAPQGLVKIPEKVEEAENATTISAQPTETTAAPIDSTTTPNAEKIETTPQQPATATSNPAETSSHLSIGVVTESPSSIQAENKTESASTPQSNQHAATEATIEKSAEPSQQSTAEVTTEKSVEPSQQKPTAETTVEPTQQSTAETSPVSTQQKTTFETIAESTQPSSSEIQKTEATSTQQQTSIETTIAEKSETTQPSTESSQAPETTTQAATAEETSKTQKISEPSQAPETTVQSTTAVKSEAIQPTTESSHAPETSTQPAAVTEKPETSSVKKSNGAQFVATDAHDTETMFPKASMMDDYDEDVGGKEMRKLNESEKREADKNMQSIMNLMDEQKKIKAIADEIKESGTLSEGRAAEASSLLHRDPIKDEERMKSDQPATAETTSPPSVLLVSKRTQKPTAGAEKESREFVQADEVPPMGDSLDESEKKVDGMRAPFDFSAFPHPPESQPAPSTQTPTELPRYTRVLQKSITDKPHLPVASSTGSKEPEFLVADRLDEISEPIRLPTSRRGFSRHPGIRRRPIPNHPPVVDEETNNSPFDFGGDGGESQHSSNGRRNKADEENGGDIFDRDGSYEQPASSDGRFSLPEARFNQRSPFEIRRAPMPRISESAYRSFDSSDKFHPRAHRPQSVDILFEKVPIEEVPVVEVTPAPIPRRDAEPSFTPPNNQPMKVPEASIFAHSNDDRPVKLMHLRKKQDPMKAQQKHALPEMSSQQLVPMAAAVEPSTQQPISPSTAGLPPLVPATHTHPITTPETNPPSTSVEIASMTSPTPAIEMEMTSTQEVATTEPAPIEDASSDSTAPEQTYDPLSFYHTVAPRRHFLKEKVLTFCTKDTAIRDQNNMVIACGVESEVWSPNRCPAGTECFSSPESLYRICCQVGWSG